MASTSLKNLPTWMGTPQTGSAPSLHSGTVPPGLPWRGLGVCNTTCGTRLESSAPSCTPGEGRFGGCSAHLVPVILLVGEHQEASVVNEDADEVLGKENGVTLRGRRGTGASRPSPRTLAVPPALPTTHLVVGLAVHLAAARGVALSTEMGLGAPSSPARATRPQRDVPSEPEGTRKAQPGSAPQPPPR